METVSVGLLLPVSGIRPMSKDFNKALKKAMNQALEGTDYEAEFLAEMIGTGSPAQVEGALDKLFGYHGVDVVTGIVSHNGIEAYVDKFKKNQVPLVLNNMGEHLIPSSGYNPYVLHNNIGIFQQFWLSGYYAASELGSKSLLVSAMYDSGYNFLTAFDMGLRAANPDIEHQLKLLPLPEPGKLSNVNEIFDQLDFENTDFVMGIFCGEEATMFLEEFKARNLQDKVKLLGLPFLLEPGEADLSGLSVYAPSHQKEDFTFKQLYRDMGTVSGKAIARAILEGEGEVAPDALKNALKDLDENRVYDAKAATQLTGAIHIVKHDFGADNELQSEIVFEREVNLDTDAEYNMFRNAQSSSWVNPYLCI